MENFYCHVRTLRKASRLSQRQLAYLLGLGSQGVLSEVEAGLRSPSFVVALASALIFEAPVTDVYDALAADVESAVLARARSLRERGDLNECPESAAFVAALIQRLASAPALV